MVEISLIRADSSTFPARISLGELDTDAGPVMCGVVTDLTEAHAQALEISDARSRRAVDEARREIDERYRLILESLTEFAILSTDFEGRVTIWNTGAAKILGWEAAEIVGAPTPMIWTREDRAAGLPQQEMATALRLGRAEGERWHLRKDGSRFWANGLMAPLRNEAGDAIGFLQTLINELNHRVKNTLATVQSISAQTLRTAVTPQDAREALDDRLMALSRAHNVLIRRSWQSADLHEIVTEALAAYRDGGGARIKIAGPVVVLPPQVALALSMALHELATNALKYGALSSRSGTVGVAWALEDGGRLNLVWTEQNGPPVQTPTRQGFGTRLINRSLAAELGGAVTIDFATTGVICSIQAVITNPPDLTLDL